MAQILDFQNVLSWAFSGVICSSCLSLWTQSIHLPLGLPLGLFPGTIISTTALTSLFSSILCMCPYQRSLISLTFSCMLFTPSSFLMSSLFIFQDDFIKIMLSKLVQFHIMTHLTSLIFSAYFNWITKRKEVTHTLWRVSAIESRDARRSL